MRTTPYKWWCPQGHENSPSSRQCCVCGANHYERYAQVHPSERAVVYYNPATGEHRTPPRADMPMPTVYANQGFERREIQSMTQWEKESGVVHEATSFNSGNEPITSGGPPTIQNDRQAMEELTRDMAEAMRAGLT